MSRNIRAWRNFLKSFYQETGGAHTGMAHDLGTHGITVNTVQPGPTETDMNPDEYVRAMLRPMLALCRIGKDREIASLIACLTSPEASFVVGSAFTVDGRYLS